MANINKAKLELLIQYLQNGGELSKVKLAAAIGGTARTKNSTIEAYLEEAGGEDENLIGLVIDGDNPYESEESESESEDEEESEEEEEDEEEEEEEKPAPKPKAKTTSKGKKRFFIQEDNGTSKEIEILKRSKSGDVITFQHTQVTQIVKLMLKGEVVEIDLVPLRKKDQNEMNEEFEMTNGKLLALAVAAN